MTRRSNCRAGFTLVELMASVSVCGTLIALLAPAIQNSRERMRDAQCRNNLRQIGLALHEHEAAYKTFPTSDHVNSRLKSYLENRTDVWQCPSDSRSGIEPVDVSYLINDGTRFRFDQKTGFAVQPMRTVSQGLRDARASEIRDGLSNTAAMSERLLVSGFHEFSPEEELLSDPKRFLWYVPAQQPDEDSLVATCEQARMTPFPLRYKTSGTHGDVGYDHIMSPNRIGCQNGPSSMFTQIGDLRSSTVTATSQHSGHVNVLMCDGAVRPVSDSVALPVWRAIGTRDGGESESLD